MKRITLLILSPFFLMGCYQTSLAPMLGPAAGASQGRIAHSAISSGISYGVKNQTGKYPIEHILKREKNKIVNVGIHLNYLIFQCLFYFICVTILYFSLSNRLNNNITFFTIAFLCLEPTINQ